MKADDHINLILNKTKELENEMSNYFEIVNDYTKLRNPSPDDIRFIFCLMKIAELQIENKKLNEKCESLSKRICTHHRKLGPPSFKNS